MKTDHRRIRLGIVVMAVVLVIAACGSSDDAAPTSTTTTTTVATAPEGATGMERLLGRWQRTGGDYSVLQGMVVEVSEDLEDGIILSVPRNPYQFQQGDEKWSDFTAVSDERIRMRDLSREADTGRMSFVTGVITVTADNDMLEIRFPSTGTLQVWSRLS